MIDLEELTSCYECNSKKIEYNTKRGEINCGDCGLVLEDYLIDQGPEWREVIDPGKTRATHGKDLRYHTPLRTSFNPQESSKENKALSRRISKAQRYVRRGVDKSLIDAMLLLENLTNQLEVSDPAHEEAAWLYRRAVKKKLIRGRSVDSIGAASLYIASRRNGKVLDYADLEEKTKSTTKEIGKCVRLLQRELKLPHKIVHPSEYTAQYLSQLYSDDETKLEIQTTIDNLLEELGDQNIGNPKSAATALLYVAGILTGHRRGQRALAEVSNLTEVTIRNRYKEIARKLDMCLDTRKSIHKKK